MRRLVLLAVALALGFGADAAPPLLVQLPGAAGCLRSDGADGCGTTRVLDSPTIMLVAGRSIYVGSFTGVVPPLSLLRRQADGSVRDVACWAYEGAAACRKGPFLAPVGMAVSPDQRTLYVASYVADAHENDDMERITVFRRDRAGLVVPLAGSSGCIAMPRDNYGRSCAGRGRGFGYPSAVAVAPDGREVYLAGSGGVGVFARSPDGALRQLSGRDGCAPVGFLSDRCRPYAWGTLPTAEADDLATGRDPSLVYVLANRWRGDHATAVVQVLRRTASGALHQLRGAGACFSSSAIASCRSERALAGAGGPSGGPGDAIDVTPDGRSMYVVAGNAVVAFAVRPSGSLRFVGSTALGAPVCRCASFAAPDVVARNRRVYVKNADDGRIVVLLRSPATGALTSPRSGSCFVPFATPLRGCTTTRATHDLNSLATSGDGRYLYGVGYYETGESPTGIVQSAEVAAFETR